MLSYSFSFLYSNHIDLKIGTVYIKSFVHHQTRLNCIFNFKFFKNSMIIFEYYEMRREWLRYAIYAFSLFCIK